MKASFKVALAMAGVCLAGRVQAQTVVVGPQAGSMALLQGAQVTVPIVADLTGSGGASLGSATLRLVWHPGVLAFRGVSGGALGQPVVNADSAGGSLRVAVANPAGVTGQPVLFSATFAVVGAPGAADTLQLQLQELTRAVTFADLLPFGVSTAAHLCVSTGLWGDLNNDGSILAGDALAILTHAVGLPVSLPYTTVNGDVDGDGQVNTRDALIVLTYVVELPVDGFRVGVMNPGGCSVQAAASVQIQPRNAAVAVGDQFPLAATVRDSAGAAVQGVNLVWTSADTTIVKADGTGHLVGVHAGTALVFAIAAPGLKDSATVTVDSLRHVWWVNPDSAARHGGVELGSQAYPYSGIGQAVARAAAFDTIRIAPATYGDTLRLTKGLTLLGDSTAAGMPVIRNPAGPGIQVGLLGAGFVRLDHLRIEDSQGGLLVNGADSVLLRWVSVERSLDVGIGITNVGRVVLDHTAVQGAIGKAVTMTAVPKVRLHAVFVDQVTTSKLSVSGQAFGVEIAGADSLVGDSLFLITAGLWVDSARVALFDGVQTALTNGPGVAAVIGDAFALDNADIKDAYSNQSSGTDSVPAVAVLLRGTLATARFTNTFIHHTSRNGLIVLGGDSVLASGLVIQDIQTFNGAKPAMFQGTRRIVLYGSAFLDNNGGAVSFEDPTNAMLVTVDSSMFRSTSLRAHHSALLDVRRSQFLGAFQSPNQEDAAVMADSVRLVALQFVDVGGLQLQPVDPSYGGPFGVNVYWADSLDIRHISIHDNPFGAVICHSCRAVVADTSEFLRNGQFSGFVSGAIGTVVLEGPTFVRVHAVRIDGGGFAGLWLRSAGMAGHFSVDSSAFVGDAMSLIYVDYFADFVSGDSLVVTGSSFGGRNHGGFGVQAYKALAGLSVSGSVFDSTSTGIGSYSAGPATVHGNRFTGVGTGLDAYSTSDVVFDSNAVTCSDPGAGAGVSLWAVGGWVTRNVVTRCLSGVWSQNQTNTRGLVVIGNTISSDSSTYSNGLLDISDSYDSLVVSGNIIQGGRGVGVNIAGNYNGVALSRVDSNTVQGMLGNGIVLSGNITNPVAMIYNVIADNDSNGLVVGAPVQGHLNTVVRNKLAGVLRNSFSSAVFDSANFVGNVQYGVLDLMGGDPVVADTSYWGDPKGPRCPTCDTLSLVGDYVSGAVNWMPPASALVVGAPPIPSIPAAPVFRAARLHVSLPTHLAVRLQPARPQGAAAARPGQRPRPTAPVSPRRVRP